MHHLRLASALLASLAPPATAQSLSNTGLGVPMTASPHATVNGDLAAFVVIEGSQGVDLNADGDIFDGVVHVMRLSTGVTFNTGATLAVSTSAVRRFWLGERLCLIASFETMIGPGGTDLNGDGDENDHVPVIYDSFTNTTTMLPLAMDPAIGLEFDYLAGDRVVFGVKESAQQADLNGDGDQLDRVLHSWRVGDTSAQNRAFAFNKLLMGRQFALCTVFEEQAGVDLNSDGDTLDQVAHAYDVNTGAITNLGIANTLIRGDGDLFALSGKEAAQGTDWNGDGDMDDIVLFAYLATTGTLRNLGSPLNLPEAPESEAYLQVQGFMIAWGAHEAQAGVGTDWNGDGDADDIVLHTHNARSNFTRNAALALPSVAQGASLRLALEGETVALSVPEASQGAADRNGDGDDDDFVIALFDARNGVVTNLGLALQYSGTLIQLTRELVAFEISEEAQGQQDLNGDGHLTRLVSAHARATAATSVLRAVPSMTSHLNVVGRLVAYRVEEGAFVPDANGDGDTSDNVLVTWDSVTGTGGNTGVAVAAGAFVASRFGLVFAVGEQQQGATDLNADLDVNDRILHVLRP